MENLFICYSKCSTCQKAKKWLEEHGTTFTERPIVEDTPTEEELHDWITRSGLPVKRFFNTSGVVYREAKLNEKLPEMSEEEQIKLLASNGMLIKRPLYISDAHVLVGFREKEWAALL